MPPRLTIAIPTVNRARLLPRAIESALAQTSSEIEIIVSDNGSTENEASFQHSIFQKINCLRCNVFPANNAVLQWLFQRTKKYTRGWAVRFMAVVAKKLVPHIRKSAG